MKRLMLKTRMIMAGLATILTVALAVPTNANPIEKEKREKEKIPVELQYRGKLNEHLIFDLVFTNEKDAKYIVTILDKSGTVLYKNRVYGKSLRKRYTLEPEVSSMPIVFEIEGKKSEQKAVYVVEKKSSVIENLAVNKIK
jgi:hypothetical protein